MDTSHQPAQPGAKSALLQSYRWLSCREGCPQRNVYQPHRLCYLSVSSYLNVEEGAFSLHSAFLQFVYFVSFGPASIFRILFYFAVCLLLFSAPSQSTECLYILVQASPVHVPCVHSTPKDDREDTLLQAGCSVHEEHHLSGTCLVGFQQGDHIVGTTPLRWDHGGFGGGVLLGDTYPLHL